MILIAVDKIIMAFIYVFLAHINIPRVFMNLYMVLQGRQKYPELNLLMSESDQRVFQLFCCSSLNHNAMQIHRASPWPT
jgi:hypothetical protein